MPDPREWHHMTCPRCEDVVHVHEAWHRTICPNCKLHVEVSWDGAPDGGSGLIPIDNPITEDE